MTKATVGCRSNHELTATALTRVLQRPPPQADEALGWVGYGYLLVVSGVVVKRANASSKLSWKVLLRAAGCGGRSRWWYQ